MEYINVNNMLINKWPKQLSSEIHAWFVWSFAGFFYTYVFILRVSPGVMTDDLMCDFSIEACALGVLSAFYYYSYAILQIPVGLGIDKFGPTLLLRGATILCITGTTFFALSESFYLACFSRLLIGAGATCAFLGSLKLATNWFPPERLALVVGCTLLAGKTGACLGQGPLALIMNAMGWRQTLLYVILPLGVVLTGGIWTFVKDIPPTGSLGAVPLKRPTLKKLLNNLKSILANSNIWIFALYGALMYVPISAFADLWSIPFLMKLYNIERAVASSACTMLFIGAGIGSPLVALLSNYFKSRKKIMMIGAVLAALFNIIIIYVPNIPFFAMYGLLFMAGFVFSAQPLIFSSVCQLTPHESNGTAISFINMIVMLSGVALQPFVGWCLSWIWKGTLQDGIPVYTASDYSFALFSIPISLILACLLIPLIPETFSQEKYSK